jgi:hypothetical protein
VPTRAKHTGQLSAPVRDFTVFLSRSPDTATVEDLRRYQLHLVDHGVSPISLNAAITGLKFFFGTTLGHARRLSRENSEDLLALGRVPSHGH